MSLSKRKLQVFLVLLVTAFSVLLPIAGNFGGDFSLNGGYSPWWLIVLYLLGGYIRKYGFFKKVRKRILLLLFFGSVLLSFLSSIIIPKFTETINSRSFVTYNSITVLASAVALLLLFSRVSINKIVSKIAVLLTPLTFSVYIIHLHPVILENIITDKFRWIAGLPMIVVIPAILGCALAIFIACSCIDLIRYYLFRGIKVKKRLEDIEERFKIKLKTVIKD